MISVTQGAVNYILVMKKHEQSVSGVVTENLINVLISGEPFSFIPSLKQINRTLFSTSVLTIIAIWPTLLPIGESSATIKVSPSFNFSSNVSMSRSFVDFRDDTWICTQLVTVNSFLSA